MYISTGNIQTVKLLKNETEDDSDKGRQILSLMSRQLVYSIPVDECLDLLLEEELVNDADKEIIEAEKNNNGPLAAAHKMFSIIPTRSHDWEQRLPGILRKCGLGEVAELIQFSDEHQKSPEASSCKHGYDQTDLKKGKCNHKRNHYDYHHHGNGRFRHEMHYETIHNRSYGIGDPNNTDKVINELRRQAKTIEEKADSHNNALTEMGYSQRKDIREIKSSFIDLQKSLKDLKKKDVDIVEELENQRKLIQNMELLHKQEFNELRNSLDDIKSSILKLTKLLLPSPPEACQAKVNNMTADSGFSAGGLSSIPEDEMNSGIYSDFGTLHDDPEEYQTKL